MDHNAGPRAACVTILTMMVVFLLSAIAIVFRLDDSTAAGALRAALACLLFVYLAYLLFEVKVLQLLLSLFQSSAAGNWFYPQPPLSFVGTFSPLGSSVGRGPSPEEAAAGGRAAASPPPSSEAGGMTSEESEYTAAADPSPPYVSGGSYHRRPRLPTGVHRLSSSSRRSSDGTWAWPSSGGLSSSEVTEQLTSGEEVESGMGGSSAAWRSQSSSAGGRRRSRKNGGGAMAYTKRINASSKR